MSHHIYTTDGFILGSKPYGESGRFFHIFTRDLGLISGTASGVRVSSSKLRYHMQDYNLANFSLVKGKEVWRITGAREKDTVLSLEKEHKVLYIKILALLKRLLHGEEKNEELFEIIDHFTNYIRSNECSKQDLLNLESIIVCRILNNLGYIKQNEKTEKILINNDIDGNILEIAHVNKKELVNEINKALKESQM